MGRCAPQRYRPDGGDLDLDASLDALVAADRRRASAVDPDDLRVRAWTKPGTAMCLLVDRSGSMGGKPLATAAVAAAAVAWRAPDDYCVLSFGKDVIAAKSQDIPKSNEPVVDAVLALRGFGTTDLAGALRAADEQLSRSRAGRKVTVLLSDCRATVPGDAVAAAAAARRTRDRRSRIGCRGGAGTRSPQRRPGHHGGRPVRCRGRPRPRPRPVETPTSTTRKWSRCRAQRDICSIFGVDQAGQVAVGSGKMPLLFWSATTAGNVDSVGGVDTSVSATLVVVSATLVVVSSISGTVVAREDLIGRVAERRLPAEDLEDRLHVVALDLGDQHGVALDRGGPCLDLIGRDGGRIDLAHHAGELEHLAGGQVGVGDDVLGERLDQRARHRRIERALVEQAAHRAPEEVLLA